MLSMWGHSDMQIDCIDEQPGSARHLAVTLSLSAPDISARDLVRARVEIEAEGAFAADEPARTRRWLVEPDAIETLLNGERDPFLPPRTPRLPDIEAMVATALDGFETGSFFLFVDDRQVTSLDERILLRSTSEVVFLKLVALKGG